MDGYESFESRLKLEPQEGLVFMHLPKTAGVSVGAFLNEKFQDDERFPIPWNSVDNSVNNLQLKKDSRFLVAGHMEAKHLDVINGNYGTINDYQYKVMTVIRDPIKRVVSEYYYSCSDAHPPHEEFIKKFPTLEHWVFNKMPRNPMVQTLTGFNNNYFKSLNFLRNNYDLILVLEDDLLEKPLANLFGLIETNLPKKNMNTNKSYSQSINAHTLAYLHEKLSIDIKIYEFVKSLYIPPEAK